jgi:hypothetical protein
VRRSLALALMLALLVPAAHPRTEVRAGVLQAPAAGDLFVLTAAGGKLERVRGRTRVFTLVLRRPAHDVTGFTDRPARRTGQRPLARFVRRWATLGFAAVPPNAAVVLAYAPSNRDVLIVELSRPRLGAAGKLVFRAKVLGGNPQGRLHGFARSADRRIAARFGRVSLFIDPASTGLQIQMNSYSCPGYPRITCYGTLSGSGLQGGSNVALVSNSQGNSDQDNYAADGNGNSAPQQLTIVCDTSPYANQLTDVQATERRQGARTSRPAT